MGVSYNPKIVKDGLVLYLDAGNTKSYPGSGTTWTDLSGNGNNGTLTDGPTYSSNNGGYLSFDGIDDYVSLPASSLPTGNQITFCIWNYGTTAQQSSVISFIDANDVRLFNIHLPWSDGTVYFDAGDGTAGGNVGFYDRIAKLAAANEYQGWAYWCFTKNATSGIMSIYRNGLLWLTSSALFEPIGTPSSTGSLGGRTILGGFHVGNISSASFYSRELTTAEIQQNFNALRGRFGL